MLFSAPARWGTLSLKRRLLWWLLLPMIVLVPASSLALYTVMSHAAEKWLDRSLGDTALALSHFISQRDGRAVAEVSLQTDKALRFDRFDQIYYLIVDPEGQTLLGDAQLAEPAIELKAGEWYFSDWRINGQFVRLAALGVACEGAQTVCQVRVAETGYKRDEMHRELLLAALVTMLLVGSALALAGMLAIMQGLRPLERLRSEMEQRDLDRLEPVSDQVPGEVRPLIAAINNLFERLRRAASAQQEFLANAAHQLRTPLTSLRTEIELALLEPHEHSVEPLLLRLQTSVDRSARLAQQMLAMARADSSRQPGNALPVDLRDIAAQAAEDWVHSAMAAGMDLGFELQSAPTRGHAFMLRELLENLVHNAISYAGSGARITVRSYLQGRSAVLEVEDTGPGVPEADRAQMLQRFQRGSQARGNGSGLGLAIARDIAIRHGGCLSLLTGSSGQGLLVRLELPICGS